ncbi:MAG: ThuA domain-containing protein [Lentisphaerae bacterium]|nr:ThuA domain-containing protein [Lentisphaerota bacterium]
MAWVRTFGKGRVFYSSFGHDQRAWLEKPTLMHLLGGIQYALRDVTTSEAPSQPQFVDPPAAQ